MAVLDRPRHEELVRCIREVGARIKLIADGDLSAAIATGVEGSEVDVLMGTGGTREGVLAGNRVMMRLWWEALPGTLPITPTWTKRLWSLWLKAASWL